MKSDSLSMRCAFSIIMLVQISNSIIIGYPGTGGPEIWISLLISAVIVTPLMVLYARLVHLMPGKDLYGMMQFAFGKWGKCIFSIFYAFYFLTLSGMVRGTYAEFVHLTSLYQTSFIIICLAFFAVCVHLAMKGAGVLGRWCFIMLILAISSIALLCLLSTDNFRLDNLRPLNQQGFGGILYNALCFVPLPLAESVVFLGVAEKLEKSVNPYKLFIFSSIASVLFFVALFLQNCSVLSWETLSTMYFPSYKAASVMYIGNIGTRIESIMSFIFIMSGISKVSIALTAGTKAVQHIFSLKDHKPLLLTVGFFSVALSATLFVNIIEMFDFMRYYLIYALPFQILIPFLLWIAAEVKMKKQHLKTCAYWKTEQENSCSAKTVRT